jgi:hypothetical protein
VWGSLANITCCRYRPDCDPDGSYPQSEQQNCVCSTVSLQMSFVSLKLSELYFFIGKFPIKKWISVIEHLPGMRESWIPSLAPPPKKGVHACVAGTFQFP